MEDTISACLALGRSCDFDEEHCLQDARLALRLFDLTSALHGLDDDDRDLLHYAGLLHDIGYVEGYEGHHKTAYRLIAAAELPGLSDRDRSIVANVARYHRGAQPDIKHAGFAALDAGDREIVRILGALLRLADGLDRTHTNAVRDVDVSVRPDRLIVLVECSLDCDAELWAAEKKGRWLGELFGRAVEVKQSPGET